MSVSDILSRFAATDVVVRRGGEQIIALRVGRFHPDWVCVLHAGRQEMRKTLDAASSAAPPVVRE